MFGFLGPVSSANPDGVGPFGYTLFTLLASCLVWATIRSYVRTRRIRRYAELAGFSYLGDQLSGEFPLSSSSFQNVTAISIAFEGQKKDRQFVSFDVTLGSGKGKIRRSVVALRGPRDSFGAERLDPSLVAESVGSWTLLYRNRGLLSPKEIEAFVSSL